MSTWRVRIVMLASVLVQQMTSTQAIGQCQLQKLAGADTIEQDEFGNAVAIDGDYAVVGANGTDGAGSSSGSAYVFHRASNGQWTQEIELTAFDASENEGFGFAVSLSGDTVAVSTPFDSEAANFAGAVYIFRRDGGGGGTWLFVKKILATDAAAGDRLGWSVSIDGDYLVVGAPQNDDGGSNSGSAYVFHRNQGGPDQWGEVVKLVAGDATDSDEFGASVAISGMTLVAGARYADGINASSGAAYVFERDLGGLNNWGQRIKLAVSDVLSFDLFGNSVSISGDLVLIGTPQSGSDSGAAYLFERNLGGADNWGLRRKLIASDSQGSAYFGSAVEIRTDYAIVGAPVDDHSGQDSGAAYVFSRNEGGQDQWGEIRKIGGWDDTAITYFGEAVAIDNQSAIVGAPYDDQLGLNSGAAHVFDLAGTDCNANGICDTVDIAQGSSFDLDGNGIPDECQFACQAAHLFASDGAVEHALGQAVALSGDTALVGAPSDDGDIGANSGAAYVFTLDGNSTWKESQKLLPSDPSAFDEFGFAVAIDGDSAIVGAYRDDRLHPQGPNIQDAGSAYIFERDTKTGVWTQVAQLALSVPVLNMQFGYAVTINADTAAVGSFNQSRVHIFERDLGGADNWGLAKELIGPAGADGFGNAIALEGDTLGVGAPRENDPLNDSGTAYIFDRNQDGSGNWGLVKKIKANDPGENDRFGLAISLAGTSVVVGSPLDDTPAQNAGSAYVFEKDQGGSNNWGQVIKLTAGSNARTNDEFGTSVSVSGDFILVGAHEGFRPGFNPGSAYVFNRTPGEERSWTFAGRLVAPDAAVDDRFGKSVSIESGTALIGAPFSDEGGAYSGSAYVIHLNGSDCNENGICDAVDIATGMSEDCDGDAVPDECEPGCLADIVCDGVVNVTDLLAVINAWGQCSSACPEDLDQSGAVDVVDLLVVISSWGPC